MPTKPQVIALEEHYLDPEVSRHFTGLDAVPLPGAGGDDRRPTVARRLYDVDELRLKEMDEAGVDFQVLSHAAPSLQKFDAETAMRLAQGVNDRLAATVKAHPDRFAAFAALPSADPKGAADELERTVTRLGFKGAMIHGLTNGLFIDDQRFWPIFERAAALDVPLYMHPSIPDPRVVEVYYKDYVEKFPTILRAAWGFTVETATQGVRLVLSGVFDKYPGLKIILGHLGEGLPLYLWRINMGFARDGRGSTWFRDAFTEHFWVTTSGFFSDPALLHCIQEIGIDRVLFSIDYPFVDNPPGTAWAERLPMSADDKEKILSGNAKRLLKL
jgi:predicted TIM-barrel fold metal-dependent hydrolase